MDDTLAGDLVALWQSELAAMAADRELRENLLALIGLWASAANTAAGLLPRRPDDTSGGTRPAQPPRAPAAAAASEPGLAELHRRLAGLEQRLAGLERRDPA